MMDGKIANEECLAEILAALQQMMDHQKVILEHIVSSNRDADRREVLKTSGLPPFPDIGNLELTFFDNGNDTKKGKTRFVLKAEINLVGKKDFKQARDAILHADIFDLWDIDMLKKRNISEEYRDLLMQTFRRFPKEALYNIAIGMFGRKGGKAGQLWFEKQYVLLFHDGKYDIIGANVYNGDAVHNIYEWKSTHMDGKAFSLEKIRAKSVSYPCKDSVQDGEASPC